MELDSAGEAAALPPKQEPCRRRSRFAGRLELVHSDHVDDGGRRSPPEGLAEAGRLPQMASEPKPLGFRAAVVARYAALNCGDVDRAFAGVAYDIAPAG